MKLSETIMVAGLLLIMTSSPAWAGEDQTSIEIEVSILKEAMLDFAATVKKPLTESQRLAVSEIFRKGVEASEEAHKRYHKDTFIDYDGVVAYIRIQKKKKRDGLVSRPAPDQQH